jgi:flavin-dependent dehydrogenase
MTQVDSPRRYDAVIVGARAAGAATALLLARAGLRVLVIDRGAYGTDTLSTHALMRGAVVQLAKWGLLEAVTAASTPAIRYTSFCYPDVTLRIPIKPTAQAPSLFAPRRYLLDRVLVDAAIASGADVRFGMSFVELLRDGERVTGIRVRDSDNVVRDCHAAIVVGADGRYSSVARAVGAATRREGVHQSGVIYGYWPAPAGADESFWYWSDGAGAGAIPTNNGEWCVFASIAHDRFADVFGTDKRAGYLGILSECAPPLFDALARTGAAPPLQGFGGLPGLIRDSIGPGWALVGDAGYFKDPITAHGLTDALRDAELLADAIIAGDQRSLRAYQETRDDLSLPLFEVTDAVASYAWTIDELKAHHHRLSDEMKREVTAMAGRGSTKVSA